MIYNVVQYLRENANVRPDAAALEDETHSVTYKEYWEQAKRIAAYIKRSCPAAPAGSPVAVVIERNINSIITFLGVAASGNFYVPLDATMPEERQKLILDNLSPIMVIDARGMEETYPGAAALAEILETVAEAPAEAEFYCDQIISTDPLYSIFTSGSTGVPKGVLVCHRSVIDLLQSFDDAFDFDETLIFGNQAPFDFDVSVKDIYNALYQGAKVVVIPRKMFVRPNLLIPYLAEKKISAIIWAVSAVRIISDFRALDEVAEAADLSFRYVMFSDEVMPVKSLNYWMDHMADTKFVNLYGPTEITCNCTYYEVDRRFDVSEMLPIGKAFANTRILLLDEEGCLIPETEEKKIGEICVEGTSLALGYWNNPEKTAESFTANPLVRTYTDRIYRTGDLGQYVGGALYFASRKDFQIKHMGHRIELGEIENAVNAIDFVDVCCCIYDQLHEKIVCFYQSETEDKKAIVAALSKKLPKYMWPNRYVNMKELPLNAHGKIDRKELAKCL